MIKIYTFQFNNPDFLEFQYKAFKKFLKEEHQLICINNSFDKQNEKDMIQDRAASLGIPHYFPEEVNHHAGSGRSHQMALNWTWRNLIMKDEGIVIIVDHDMFPIKEFKLYPEYDVISVMQGRGANIKYFHPGIMIIHPSLKDREQVDFIGENIDGHDCDSGGNWHHYLKSHPELKIKGLSLVNVCDEHENMDVIPEQFRDGYEDTKPFQILEDYGIHCLDGSNWGWAENHVFGKKKERLYKLLEHYLAL